VYVWDIRTVLNDAGLEGLLSEPVRTDVNVDALKLLLIDGTTSNADCMIIVHIV
jgi:hypothetical protein